MDGFDMIQCEDVYENFPDDPFVDRWEDYDFDIEEGIEL